VVPVAITAPVASRWRSGKVRARERKWVPVRWKASAWAMAVTVMK